MKKIFDYDGPVMQFLIKVTDFFLLSVLACFFSIPIITGGAAYTAKYRVAMMIVRDEGPSVFREYWKSFKENFVQSTKWWMIFLVIFAFLIFDWSYIAFMGVVNISVLVISALAIITLIVIMMSITIFGMIARFNVKGLQLLKMCIMVVFARIHFWIASILCAIGAIFLTAYYFEWFPLFVFCGSALVTFVHAFLLTKTFQYLEEPEKEEQINLEVDG